MTDRACEAIEGQIGAVERRIDRLRENLEEPTLNESQRRRIRRLIAESEDEIIELDEALRRCRAPLSIVGVEQTQGIQFFSINGQGSGAGRDNSIPILAQRTLILRVYPDHKRGNPLRPPLYPVQVSGEVLVERRSGNRWRRVTTLKPINGPVIGRSAAELDRGEADHTLNFRLAAVECQGFLRFTVTVFEESQDVADDDSPPVVGRRASFSIVESAKCEPVPATRIRSVLIHYTGDGMDLPAPSGFDFAESLEYVLKTFPVGRIEFGDCQVEDFDGNLRLPGEGCTQGWLDLLDFLRELQRMSDDPDAIYLGLVPRGAISDNSGCGGGWVAAAIEGRLSTFAQELGHAVGRKKHAPAGDPPDPDPKYPQYGAYPSGSIGEFGFDPVTSRVHDPANTYDFMSYAFPQWVSPYTYLAVRDHINSRFGDASRMRRAERPQQDMLLLSFRVHRDGSVDVAPSFHLPLLPRLSDGDQLSEFSIELLDAQGQVLVFQRCHISDVNPPDPYGPFMTFHESIPWSEQATAIRFLRKTDILHIHDIEDRAPEVRLAPGKLRSREGRIDLEWSGNHSHDLRYMVRYSSDGGASWRVVATNLRTPALRLNARRLAGGDHCLVQVAATSGIRTSLTESAPFANPVQSRVATILSPKPMTEVPAGASVELLGGAYSPDFGLGDLSDTVWSSSLDGHLGRGVQLVVESLSIGPHIVTVAVPDGAGGNATASVTMRVIEAG